MITLADPCGRAEERSPVFSGKSNIRPISGDGYPGRLRGAGAVLLSLFHLPCSSVRSLPSEGHAALPTPPVAPAGGWGLRCRPSSPRAGTKEAAALRGAAVQERGARRGEEGCCEDSPGIPPGMLRGRGLPLSRRGCSEARVRHRGCGGPCGDGKTDRAGQTAFGRLPARADEGGTAARALIKGAGGRGAGVPGTATGKSAEMVFSEGIAGICAKVRASLMNDRADFRFGRVLFF